MQSLFANSVCYFLMSLACLMLVIFEIWIEKPELWCVPHWVWLRTTVTKRKIVPVLWDKFIITWIISHFIYIYFLISLYFFLWRSWLSYCMNEAYWRSGKPKELLRGLLLAFRTRALPLNTLLKLEIPFCYSCKEKFKRWREIFADLGGDISSVYIHIYIFCVGREVRLLCSGR